MRHECPNCGMQFENPTLEEMENVMNKEGYRVRPLTGLDYVVITPRQWELIDPDGDNRMMNNGDGHITTDRDVAVRSGYERVIQDKETNKWL